MGATRIPSPPALDTAAAISAYPTHIIPPWTIGLEMPSAEVKSVEIGIVQRSNKTMQLTAERILKTGKRGSFLQRTNGGEHVIDRLASRRTDPSFGF
jgi:hypothetical protein